MGERRTDTREKIRAVALELFAEHGYEKTSLREIAERLGVTKAALYYHFKTKEDIVSSLFLDAQYEVEKLIAWAKQQPSTLETRQEVIRRYAAMVHGPVGRLMRFMSENNADVRALKSGDEARERFIALAEMLSDKDAPVPDQLRARLSIFSLHMGLFLMRDMDISDEERSSAALDVALELVSGSNVRQQAHSAAG
jgi:AcrR family transcriptional regulator